MDKMSTLKANKGMNMGFGNVQELEFYETPFTTANELMGGGFVKGKYTIVAGPSQVGKTTIIQQTIAHQQAKDPEFICLWTDAENSLDPEWCEQLGMDMDRVIVQRYSTDEEEGYAEKILQQGLELMQSGEIDFWVIDSIGALLPKSEMLKDIEENTMLDLQRKLGVFFRKANPVFSKVSAACVLIGHVYDAPTSTGITLQQVKGGNAVKHWAYTRLLARRGRKDLAPPDIEVTQPDGEKKKMSAGWAQVLKLDKSKTNANEGQEIILKFLHGRGFDSVECAISALFANEVIERRGGWFYSNRFPDEKIQGKPAVVEFLKLHPVILEQLVQDMDLELATLNNSENLNNSQEVS